MKNKITIIFAAISLMATLIVGCGNTATPAVSASRSLSTATQLALGTLKLESTRQVVTTEQAAQLLIL